MPVYNTGLTAVLPEPIKSCSHTVWIDARRETAPGNMWALSWHHITKHCFSAIVSKDWTTCWPELLPRSYYILTNVTCDGGKKSQPQALICSLFLTKATSFSEGSFHCSGNEVHVGETEKQFVVVKSPRLRPGPSAQRFSYAFSFYPLKYKKYKQYFF